MPAPIRLDHRAVVSVTGEDATTFLSGLITNTVAGANDTFPRYAALLTPQGKVIADFLVFRSEDGFLFDCAQEVADDLIKRLSMFKLRSKVAVARRDDLCAIAFDGSADPRHPGAPARSIMPRDAAPSDVSSAAYHAVRIPCGLAEQGIDFGANEVFPADINMDEIDGVDFKKGCFVGQEVVSRMKRRGTARRRTMVLEFAEDAVVGPVMADEFEIGAVTSTAGAHGLARLRVDRLAEAEDAGHAVMVDGVSCIALWPDWLEDVRSEGQA